MKPHTVVCLASLLCLVVHPGALAQTNSPVAPAQSDYARDRILTPPVQPTPRINGAKVFGARPGSPFLFRVAASGEKPLSFAASGLPAGLQINPTNGVITGSVKTPGEHRVKLTVKNRKGAARGELRIVIGDTIALTPPMGWNSWYCWSESVSQEHICAMADAIVASGLAEHGWTYVNIDDCWQGVRGGKFNALQGNERFPDMQQMCDYVHSLGLKVGIYSTPWIGSYAGFPGGSCSNAAGDYLAEALPLDQRPQPAQLFGRYPRSIKRGLNHVGPFWFCDADAKQWGEWGFDYVKYDWHPNDVPTTRRLAAGLRDAGRDILLSLSNAAEFDTIPDLSSLANLWRTTGDIHESWESINRIGFSQDEWQAFSRPGHWNDPDMLQVGMIGTPNAANHSAHRTKLTPDEQYTQVSLWCLLSAPLLLSCDLRQLDAFSFNLLANDEVLEVDQDPKGAGARRLPGDEEIWVKPMADGSLAVGLFNRSETEKQVSATWSALGLSGKMRVRDLWQQKDLGQFEDEFISVVRPHGVVFIRIISKPAGKG
jgi:alpha-galactosidase